MKRTSILVLAAILAAVGAYYLFSRLHEPPTPPAAEPRAYVWSVEFLDLQHLTISLPREKRSESFLKGADRQWYFDRQPPLPVDPKRWGGGIPLLLTGPGAERLLMREAPPDKLTEYGFDEPSLEIVITLESGESLEAVAGDRTPGDDAFYLKRADSSDVYTVNSTWYEVLERLVLEPPRVGSESEP